MRMSCPNYSREDGLETVLEVPIPEEMFVPSTKNSLKSWRGMKSWMRSHIEKTGAAVVTAAHSSELQILLGVVGAPLIPLQVPCGVSINRDIKDHPTESSMAKYIVQQYIAATGGDKAMNGINSMYAMGKVKMMACGDIYQNDVKVKGAYRRGQQGGGGGGSGEVGAFVLWQKRPDLWCLELVLSGCKIGAGSDGKVAWRQTPWHHSHASRGPPRPLRRSLQGLDPRSTASLFSKSVYVGEKSVNDEDCFVLKLQAEPSSLRARSSKSVEIIRHTILGYFSQRTGLLVKLEDSNLIRITTTIDDNVYWETTMESLIQDYRKVDGINIAHGGRTLVSLFRFGEGADSNHSRTRMEEVWTIEEVDFNIKGLTMDCFLPPSDMKKEQDDCSTATNHTSIPVRTRAASTKMGSSKVTAVDLEDSDSSDRDDDDET